MGRIIVLKIDERRGAFSKAFEIARSGETVLLTIKNKQSCLKKAAKQMKNENILIERSSSNNNLCLGKIKEFKNASPDVFMPVLDKICRQSAKEFSMTLPYGEVYVIADRKTAQCIIDKLHSISRFFTIVSAEEKKGEMFDSLYYKYGTPVRQIRTMELKNEQEAIVINATDENVRCHKEIPVIELGKASSQSIKKIYGGDIYISDEKMHKIEEIWGGRSGAYLYSLLGKTPAEDAVVKTGEKADKIFLLDTDKF